MRARPRLRVGIRAQMVVLFMAFYTLQGCGKVLLKYVYTWAAALEKGACSRRLLETSGGTVEVRALSDG